MKMRTVLLGGIVSAFTVGGAFAATVPVGAVGYSLGNNGNTLVTMANLNMPNTASGAAITSADGTSLSLSALAFRPKTRQVYGYSDIDDTVYLVDVNTAVATKVVTAAAGNGTSTDAVGFDFNNVLDAARIVTVADENRVFFPNNDPANIAGQSAGIMNLAYAAGDKNAGKDPSVFANAYTNAVPNPTSNVQYVLDSQTDSLAILANNTGVLSTVGNIFVGDKALDFVSAGGFDILSLMEGSNQALALLSTSFSTALYQIDLTPDSITGRINAILFGDAPQQFGALDGFAVASPAPVPLPAGIMLLGTGLAGFAAMKRRRKTA